MMAPMLTRRTFVQGALAAALFPAEARAALPPKQLRALRPAVGGRVLAPGNAGSGGARVVLNPRSDGVPPPAVVRARDAADVLATVRWADRHGVPLVVRS